MGPLLVLVCPTFRGNVIVTCKIVSFLCNLGHFLLKNVIVSFSGNQISKWWSFEKGLFLTNFSHFLVTREKTQKFLQHISHLHTYTNWPHPIDSFSFPIFPEKQIYHVCFFFSVTPGVDSFLGQFGAINK